MYQPAPLVAPLKFLRPSPVRRTLLVCLSLLVLITLAGCGDAESWLATAERMSTQPMSLESPNQQAAESVVANLSFNPINPSRDNPFSYGGRFATPEERAFSNGLSKVLVLGFAKTDRPTVILRVGTQTYTLHVGDQAAGIEVLEITRPTVTLKSNSAVWTASMFDS